MQFYSLLLNCCFFRFFSFFFDFLQSFAKNCEWNVCRVRDRGQVIAVCINIYMCLYIQYIWLPVNLCSVVRLRRDSPLKPALSLGYIYLLSLHCICIHTPFTCWHILLHADRECANHILRLECCLFGNLMRPKFMRQREKNRHIQRYLYGVRNKNFLRILHYSYKRKRIERECVNWTDKQNIKKTDWYSVGIDRDSTV